MADRNARLRERRARHRDQVFAAYGGPWCACCGEDELTFLTLDHVAGDGAEHRREIGKGDRRGGDVVYVWLLRHDFPPGYQVLCMNCNIGKHRNGGVCPHAARGTPWDTEAPGIAAPGLQPWHTLAH